MVSFKDWLRAKLVHQETTQSRGIRTGQNRDYQCEQWKRGKRDRSDIVKLGGPADVRATFTRARHFDFSLGVRPI